MFLELTDVQSIHPDFKLPTRRNGDPLEPSNVVVHGQYLVCRYFGWEPVSGPAVDEYCLDVFYNSDGREVLRATSRMVEPPPEPPTFFERLHLAWRLILGMRPEPA
jgi:hypothetical protein